MGTHRTQVRKEVTNHLNTCVDSLGDETNAAASREAGARSLHSVARKHKRCPNRSLPAFNYGNGKLLTDPDGITRRWWEHWQRQFGGTPVHWRALRPMISRCFVFQSHRERCLHCGKRQKPWKGDGSGQNGACSVSWDGGPGAILSDSGREVKFLENTWQT